MKIGFDRRVIQSAAVLMLCVAVAAAVGGCVDPQIGTLGGNPEVPGPPTLPPPAPPPPPPSPPENPLPPAPPPGSAGYSAAALAWTPGPGDTCTQEDHLRYTASGPDGKLYPIWHPPVDPLTGCNFGHEHGTDPSTSPLDTLGPMLFGYVNEQALASPNFHRHEDHVGHKVEVANGVTFTPSGGGAGSPTVCNVVAKLHQGTHSPDAFSNNLHEQVTRVSCDNGLSFELQLLSAIGRAGGFADQCAGGSRLQVGSPNPSDSPTASNPLNPGGSMGDRFLPTIMCVDAPRPKYSEVWKTQNVITGVDGSQAARFAWYWSVSDPSRYFAAGAAVRTINSCYTLTGSEFLTISNPCVGLRAESAEAVTWDDPRSPFKGTHRGIKLNDFSVTNPNGPEIFFTDVLGMNGSTTPFPGSVQQHVRQGSHAPYAFGGPSIGSNHDAPGVHAPN